jgi:hypothetical protein
LVHGFGSLGKYFGRYRIELDAERIADRIIASLDRFGVLSEKD